MKPAAQLAELGSLVLGDLIGEGSARKVYLFNDGNCWGRDKRDASLCAIHWQNRFVVKVEEPGKCLFQNVSEWITWDWLRAVPRLSQWLSPCVAISPCGTYLVQRRVEPIRTSERPKKLPRFLTDIATENFGMLDGQLVCCDYGTLACRLQTLSDRMIKVDWQDKYVTRNYVAIEPRIEPKKKRKPKPKTRKGARR